MYLPYPDTFILPRSPELFFSYLYTFIYKDLKRCNSLIHFENFKFILYGHFYPAKILSIYPDGLSLFRYFYSAQMYHAQIIYPAISDKCKKPAQFPIARYVTYYHFFSIHKMPNPIKNLKEKIEKIIELELLENKI